MMKLLIPCLLGLLSIALLYGGFGMLFSSGSVSMLPVTTWPGHEPAVPAKLIAGGLVVGALSGLGTIVLLLVDLQVDFAGNRAALARLLDPLAFVVLGIVFLGLEAVFEWKVPPLSAAVVVALASGAIVATWVLAALLWRGEAIEIDSRWGGLGGDLGGVRLSRTASLALVAIALAIGCVAAVRSAAGSAGEAV